jgi:hypothetical protein
LPIRRIGDSCLDGRSFQDAPDAADQLVYVKRLCDIIVAAQAESVYLGIQVAERAYDYYRKRFILASDHFQDILTVAITQVEIEKHKLDGAFCQFANCVSTPIASRVSNPDRFKFSR